MKKFLVLAAVCLCTLGATAAKPAKQSAPAKPHTYDPYVALEFDLGVPVKFFRAASVNLGGGQKGLAVVFSENPNIDPYEGLFTFPEYTVKLAVFTLEGKELWRRELPYAMPGMWFLPMLPMDMDSDGVDEIYYVNCTGPLRLKYENYKLERADVHTGKVTGDWPWIIPTHNQANSYKWRFFLVGGYVKGEPVLIGTQGTYTDMRLRAWNKDFSVRWEKYIPDDKKGPRSSHSTPVLDLDNDGVDEFMHGERCISFDDGRQLFVLDGEKWNEHSDMVLPIWDAKTNMWNFMTVREKEIEAQEPRAIMFNQKGDRLWQIPETRGHYHYSWVGDLGPKGERVVFAGRYPADRNHPTIKFEGRVYNAETGEPMEMLFPVGPGWTLDIDGDGLHELASGGKLWAHDGRMVLDYGSTSTFVSGKKLLPLPGEQLTVISPDGKVRVWADRNAKETPAMTKRFAERVYQENLRQTAVGYNYKFPILNY